MKAPIAIALLLAATAARADNGETLKTMLINGSAIIGQSIACDLPKDRLNKVMTIHAATVEALSKHDPKAMKMRDDIIKLALDNEKSRPVRRCDVIETAFSTFERALSERGLMPK